MGHYDRNICTQLFKREMLPGPTPAERDQLAREGLRISMEHVLWIDADIIPGAYYGESTWIWPKSYPHQIGSARLGNQKPMFPHAHDFPEILSWWGTDPDHPEDTNGMTMLIGDREFRLDQSWAAYIPAGVLHMPGPLPGGKVTRRPVCHWTFGPGVYTREADHPAAAPAAPVNVEKSVIPDSSKCVVYGFSSMAKRPPYLIPQDPRYVRPVAYIDEAIVPGAELGCATFWLLPGAEPLSGRTILDAHTLPHGTSITLTTMNYADITDLCAEAELWIGGEKHIINKSFGAYIPPGVEQGPLIVRNITQQMFLMLSYPVGAGIAKYPGGR
jgi:hypothetical protein